MTDAIEPLAEELRAYGIPSTWTDERVIVLHTPRHEWDEVEMVVEGHGWAITERRTVQSTLRIEPADGGAAAESPTGRD